MSLPVVISRLIEWSIYKTAKPKKQYLVHVR